MILLHCRLEISIDNMLVLLRRGTSHVHGLEIRIRCRANTRRRRYPLLLWLRRRTRVSIGRPLLRTRRRSRHRAFHGLGRVDVALLVVHTPTLHCVSMHRKTLRMDMSLPLTCDTRSKLCSVHVWRTLQTSARRSSPSECSR